LDVRWFLTALRTATFLGLLVLYLQPHWRTEREDVQNSRVLLLVDTSLSMGLIDGDPVDNSAAKSAAKLNRDQQIAAGFKDSDFLTRLRKIHDVTVLQFAKT